MKFKGFMNSLALGIVLIVAACATQPNADANAKFNNNAAKIEQGTQVVQKAATASLRAGAFTVAQDQLIQKYVDLVHQSGQLAKTLQVGVVCATTVGCTPKPPDPVAAAKEQENALAILKTLKTTTGVPND